MSESLARLSQGLRETPDSIARFCYKYKPVVVLVEVVVVTYGCGSFVGF